MRNCLVGISDSFSSNWRKFSSSCLSCFGLPKNKERMKPQVNTPNAEIVFVSQFPDLDEDLEINSVTLKISQKDLMPTPETHNLNPKTQTLELEFKAIEPQTPELINYDIIKQQNTKIRLLEQLSDLYKMQTNELQVVVSNLSTRMDKLEALNSSQAPQSKTLQPEEYPQFLTDQTFASTLPSDWLIASPRMYSPVLFQNQPTLTDLQDFSDPIPFNHVDDSVLNNSQSSINFQSSTGTLTQSTETNISYFPKDDKTMERNLILLEKASINAVDGVSDFSKVMDAITKDLEEAINDPSYPTKSIALAPSSPSPSPSSTSNNPAPRVLGVRVVGPENRLVIC